MRLPPDFYKILGVNRDTSQEGIKKAFRLLARKYHPDTNLNDAEFEAKFKEALDAYKVLSNPDMRAKYDFMVNNSEPIKGYFRGFARRTVREFWRGYYGVDEKV